MAAALLCDGRHHPLLDDRLLQLRLVAEVVVQQRRIDAGFGGDGAQRRGGDAVAREAAQCRVKQAFAQVGKGPGPSVIVAQTVRGKGLPSIERRADRWFVNFTHDEIAQLMQELHGEAKASLASETLMVR